MSLIAASLCVACAGTTVSGKSNGTGGAAGASGSGGAPQGGTGGAPQGGTGGAPQGGTGGAPPVSTCTRTHDAATCLGVVGYDGQIYGCTGKTPTGGGAVSWSTTGIVTKVTSGSFIVDSCAPDANCAPMLSTISVAAPNLTLDIPVGAIASVTYGGLDAGGPTGPSPGLVEVESVGDWGGQHNPDGAGRLYLVVSDGRPPSAYDACAATGAPYDVTLEKLACSHYGKFEFPDPAVGDYALHFCSAGSPDVIVKMGETKSFTVAGHPMHVRNLRSFLSGELDANWDWAYWISP